LSFDISELITSITFIAAPREKTNGSCSSTNSLLILDAKFLIYIPKVKLLKLVKYLIPASKTSFVALLSFSSPFKTIFLPRFCPASLIVPPTENAS